MPVIGAGVKSVRERPGFDALTQTVTRPGTKPRVSVIIVNYNGLDDLKACLRSLEADSREWYDVIVVDNASTDGSAKYVPRNHPQVKVVENGVNLGFGHGSNVGASLAEGAYLAFLNPDTVVEPGWLDALVVALDTHPRAGLATSKIVLRDDPERVNTCGNRVHCTGLTLCRGMGAGRTEFRELTWVSAVSGAAFVVLRDVFETLGGFDETFFLYMEDTDLSWRARLAGYRCLFVPDSVVHHDYVLRFGPQKTYYQERNRYVMLLKSLRWGTLLVHLPALLLGEVVTWGFVLLREPGRAMNKLRAYAWIAEHWGNIMEARRRTQTLRRVPDSELIGCCSHRLAFEQTGDGLVTRIAHWLFDPLFFLLQWLALHLMPAGGRAGTSTLSGQVADARPRAQSPVSRRSQRALSIGGGWRCLRPRKFME